MTTEIKPCQYCASAAAMEHGTVRGFYVECFECEAQGPLRDTPEAAVADWNRVASMAEALAPLAAEAEGWADDDPDDLVMTEWDGLSLTLGDARRAAALLPPTTQAEG